MRRRISLVLSALIAVSLVGGCTAPTPQTPAPSSSTSVTATPTSSPTPTSTPATPQSTAAGSPVGLRVYFSYHEKMQPAPRTAPAGTTAVLRAALKALLAGPGAKEKAGGLVTMVPSGTKLLGVSIKSKVAIVDLNGKFESGGGTLSMTNRLAQVVFTATQFSTVKSVTFKIDGKVVKVFGGEGIIVDPPRTRKSFEDASPAILVERPAWRATLSQGAEMSGTANVFEAVFRLQIRDKSGKLVMNRTVHASSGTGTRGTWSLKAKIAGAKAGLGKLRVYAESPKDGSPIDVVNIPVVLDP